jgi:hypothetical protein
MRKVAGAGTPGKYNYANPNLKELLDKAIPVGCCSDSFNFILPRIDNDGNIKTAK